MMDGLHNDSEPDGFLEDCYQNLEAPSICLEVTNNMEKVVRQNSGKSWSAASSSEENSAASNQKSTEETAISAIKTSSSVASPLSTSEDWSSASNGSMAALEGGSGRLGTALSYPCLASVSSVSATTTTAAAAPVSFSVGSAPLQSSSVSSQSAAETEPLAPVVSPPSPLQSSRNSRSRSSERERRGSGSTGEVGTLPTSNTSSREASLEKERLQILGTGSAGDASSVLDHVSIEGGESGGSGSLRSFELPVLRNSESFSSGKQARSGGKRKSSWYHMLNPTYRSRCEDFKRIFKDLPVDERLIVDYSCALQRDILLQGRIYVTQNYLCFYANIFRWETLVQLRWKEVCSLTKEKTALVIPNAIQICSDSDKHFFCSFGARDKTYVVLFRTWQQALLDQPIGNQELWNFVHSVYGAELGFSSHEEEGIEEAGDTGVVGHIDVGGGVGGVSPVSSSDLQLLPPTILHSSPSESLHSAQTSNDDPDQLQLPVDTDTHLDDWRDPLVIMSTEAASVTSGASFSGTATLRHTPQFNSGKAEKLTADLPAVADFTDSSESEDERVLGIGDELIVCPAKHEGREIINVVLPMSVDELFTLLFTNSTFYMDYLTNTLKSTDLQMGQWEEGGEKTRNFSYTIPLNNNIGIKSCRTTEHQTLLDVSRPGEMYAVNSEATNTGIPYADTFFLLNHFCILRCGSKQSRLVLNCQIKYRKSVWGIVKTFIEKNTWAGVEENFEQLKQQLQMAYPSRDAEERSERRAELPHPPAAETMTIGTTKARHPRPTRRRRGAAQTGFKDDSGVETRRLGSHHLASSLSESQIATRNTFSSKPAAGRTDKGQQYQMPASNTVLYVVFVTLLLLLLTNGLLYMKIWTLEHLAEQLANNPSCPTLSPSPSSSNMADLRVLTNKPQSPEEWMELLRQQETIHRATENKWRQTLSTVSSFLHQTQESLMALEKDIEPDSGLIRSLLQHMQQQQQPLPQPQPQPQPQQPRASALRSDPSTWIDGSDKPHS